MPHKLPSFQHFSVLLGLTLFLALFVSVSASAFRLGTGRDVPHPGAVTLDLLIDSEVASRLNQELAAVGIRRAMKSLHRTEDFLSRRFSESEEGLGRMFRGRWTKLGRRLDHLALASDPPTSSVPEPSTAVLMSLGLAGLAGTARRMRVRSS